MTSSDTGQTSSATTGVRRPSVVADLGRDARAPLSPVNGAAEAYAELATIILHGQPLGAVMSRIARIAHDVIPEADEVSITLVEGGRARSVAFSGRLAAALDERQYQDGYGPCLDAALSGGVMTIADTAAETTYPDIAAQAARAGIRHTMSIPIAPVVADRPGALNLYAGGEPFSAEDREVGTAFASYAAVAIANAAVYSGALDQVAHLQTAMASRAIIEQAKGILMAGQGCTPDQAFVQLREASNRENRKLRDVAQDLVQNTIA